MADADEKTPLLGNAAEDTTLEPFPSPDSKRHEQRTLWGAVAGALRAILSTIFAPGYYIIACFYDDDGSFSAAMPLKRISRAFTRKPRKEKRMAVPGRHSRNEKIAHSTAPSSRPGSWDSSSATDDSPARHTRSQSSSSSGSDDGDRERPKRAIRIKTLSDQVMREKRAKNDDAAPTLTVDTIKSPTSAPTSAKILKYPRAPAPPRPLIPKRHPSYSLTSAPTGAPQKTLVIDLDETLIHSMAKGGRMSTGHMVEVKLQTPVGIGGGVLGPQVPILYWVNKRPHCDEFLRKVSKWFNLIVFTASVQEYADPVIDWLELERKYFSARYYRQHCTFRNGAYIKDLSHVEPDLSRVMILDNSPMSYVFHEDNAIPIEGWISDPTDNDLLHLLPLLEGLQYTTDVRSLLALRLGEASPP